MKSSSKKLRLHRHHAIILAVIASILVAIGALAWVLHVVFDIQSDNLGRLVTVYDRGEEKVILTHAKTVRGALLDARVDVTKQDVVEPDIDSQLLSSDSAIIIYRSRPILVVDGAQVQKVVTAAASPNQIAKIAGFKELKGKDDAEFSNADFIKYGTTKILTIDRAAVKKKIVKKQEYKPGPQALTAQKGAQLYVDKNGVAHRETYYDLPMNVVINACGPNNKYTIRAIDGAKVDKDGYILVAANYNIYPRCSVVETSMGPGKVYDTGGFALRYPHGFDLATDWSIPDGL